MTLNQVIKEIKELRSDCSSGADHVPVKFNKLVAADLVSSLKHIINTCIETLTFPFLRGIARILSILKVDRPAVEIDYRPVYELSRKFPSD